MPVARSASMRAQSAGAEHAVSVPLSLSTQRNAGMSSLEPTGYPPGSLPSATRDRSPTRSTVRAVGKPAGHVGGVAVPHRPPEHREREPVDLEVDDPGNVRRGRAALAAGDPLDDP